MHRLNSVIAAHSGIRQDRALELCIAAGHAADRQVQILWRQLLGALKDHNPYRVGEIWQKAAQELIGILYQRFTKLAAWSHRSAVKTLTQSLPRWYLRAVPALATQESLRQLWEEGEATTEPAFSWDEWLALLFPPPSAADVSKIILSGADGQSWTERLAQLSRLATPLSMAAAVEQGYAAGETQRDIAKRLLPLVAGVRSSAMRVARTEGMRIAHTVQMQCHEQLGDLVVAYQVHSSFGENARHDHALRSGTVYWREPKPGQYGWDVLPLPPVDRGGPHEDGIGVKQNCRCWNSPVLRPPGDFTAEQRDVFENNAHAVIPSPAVYSDWFATATRPQKERAVGVRRYRDMESILGDDPTWQHFVNPRTGKLVSRERLANEGPQERRRRLLRVQALLAKRRRDIVNASTFGFLEQPSKPSRALAMV